jgi:hypothetical protein
MESPDSKVWTERPGSKHAEWSVGLKHGGMARGGVVFGHVIASGSANVLAAADDTLFEWSPDSKVWTERPGSKHAEWSVGLKHDGMARGSVISGHVISIGSAKVLAAAGDAPGHDWWVVQRCPFATTASR